jgi:hypothetical protein
MKQELSVEYPRKEHPKLDAVIEKVVGVSPYHTALGGRVRTLEFVFDDVKAYNAAYDKLSRIRGVTVIGGRK